MCSIPQPICSLKIGKASQVSQPSYGKQPVKEEKSESPEFPTQIDFETDGFAVVDNQSRTLNKKFTIN